MPLRGRADLGPSGMSVRDPGRARPACGVRPGGRCSGRRWVQPRRRRLRLPRVRKRRPTPRRSATAASSITTFKDSVSQRPSRPRSLGVHWHLRCAGPPGTQVATWCPSGRTHNHWSRRHRTCRTTSSASAKVDRPEDLLGELISGGRAPHSPSVTHPRLASRTRPPASGSRRSDRSPSRPGSRLSMTHPARRSDSSSPTESAPRA